MRRIHHELHSIADVMKPTGQRHRCPNLLPPPSLLPLYLLLLSLSLPLVLSLPLPLPTTTLSLSSPSSDPILPTLPDPSPSSLPPHSLPLNASSPSRRRLLWQYFGVDSGLVLEPTVARILRGRPKSVAELSRLAAQRHVAARARTPMLLAVFTAPRPFEGAAGEAQRRALSSWLRLRPAPRVVLLGNHPSFYAVAGEFERVSVEPRVDCNYRGVPLFNSMLARAMAAKHPFSMLVPPDVIILSNIIPALQIAFHKFGGGGFVMTGEQTEVARFPNGLHEEAAVKQYVERHGKRGGAGGVQSKVGFWVWNNSPIPLHNSSMPPFAYQRGKHDSWLAHEVAAAGFRTLVDASDLVKSVRVKVVRAGGGGGGRGREEEEERRELGEEVEVSEEESGRVKEDEDEYEYTTPPGKGGSEGEGEGEGERERERRKIRLKKWNSPRVTLEEVAANRQMAEQHVAEVRERNWNGKMEPWKGTRCTLNSKRSFCLKPVNCSYLHPRGAADYSSSSSSASSDWICRHVSLAALQSPPRSLRAADAPKHNYNRLEDLLPRVADERKIVTLVAVSSLYKDMLMSFICMLRRLDLPNPLVAALDSELYDFGVEQGLAVFFDKSAQEIHLASTRSGAACKFGTPCFKEITKLKSRTVLHVLQLGYSVLWSDVDIVWFRDPLPELVAYEPGVFPVQSDQPLRKMKPNGANGTSILGGAINSGFYFARSERKVIEAFEAIVADAKTTNTSEQPSFYRVLCGEGGEYARGIEECVWPQNGLRTVFVPRYLHPNGKVYFYWYAQQTAFACVSKGCATLHNNWIKGKQSKINRFKAKGLWYYDARNRLCVHTWYRNTRGLPQVAREEEQAESQDPVAQ